LGIYKKTIEIFNATRILLSLRSIDLPEDLEEFAERCKDKCCEWFGKPEDYDWEVYTFSGPLTYSQCVANVKQYWIVIDRVTLAEQDMKALSYYVANEMYHRVVWTLGGLRSKRWIDEIVADATAYELLRLEGFDLSPSKLHAHLRTFKKLPDEVLSLQMLTWDLTDPKRRTPTEYRVTAILFGRALRNLVGWDVFRKIPGSANWAEWLAYVPEPQRAAAACLLKPAVTDEPETFAQYDIANLQVSELLLLGEALAFRGKFDEAIAVSNRVLSTDPGNVEAMRIIADCERESGSGEVEASAEGSTPGVTTA